MQPKPVKYSLFKNFKYAFEGLFASFKKEPNLTIQLLIGLLSSVYFFYFEEVVLSLTTLVMMSIVISLELINTSFEYLCDLIEPRENKKVKFIKDVAAAAVLTASTAWLLVILYGLWLTKLA